MNYVKLYASDLNEMIIKIESINLLFKEVCDSTGKQKYYVGLEGKPDLLKIREADYLHIVNLIGME